MELWLDTNNLETVKTAIKYRHLTGVTTNPSLLAKCQFPPEIFIDKVLSLDDRIQVAAQVIGETEKEILQQGRRLANIDSRILIKVPVNQNGLALMPILLSEGIPVMATTVFTPIQVILACLVKVPYIAIYYSKIADNCSEVVNKMQNILKQNSNQSKLLAASIKTVDQLIDVLNQGVSTFTLPDQIYQSLLQDTPQTSQYWKKFIQDWRNNPITDNSQLF